MRELRSTSLAQVGRQGEREGSFSPTGTPLQIQSELATWKRIVSLIHTPKYAVSSVKVHLQQHTQQQRDCHAMT